MSGSVGAVAVAANAEHLLQDLSDCTQGIELSTLYLVEQPAQLGIVRHDVLDVRFGPGGCDGEDLTREVARTPLLEPARALEICPVSFELLPQLGHVLSARRLGE